MPASRRSSAPLLVSLLPLLLAGPGCYESAEMALTAPVIPSARSETTSMVSAPRATLTLEGLTVGGEAFMGSDTIVVQ